MVNRVQVKMARVALGWGVRDLAREAGLTPPTITKFETGGNVTIETVEKIPRNLTTTLGFMRGTTSRDPGRIYVASKRLDIPSKPKPKDKPKDK